MINVEFLIITYFVSLSVDWICQQDWQASNKSKWGKGSNYFYSFIALFSHSFTYALLTSCTSTYLSGLDVDTGIFVFKVLFVSHFIIDTRIPVKLIMSFKGMSKNQINDYVNYGFMHIGIDHRLHELTILALAYFINN